MIKLKSIKVSIKKKIFKRLKIHRNKKLKKTLNKFKRKTNPYYNFLIRNQVFRIFKLDKIAHKLSL
jgi:hypothetical protein